MYPDVRSPNYLPIRTIVKFYHNHQDHRGERNQLISKTLGKLVMIENAWDVREHPRRPADGEWWMIDLIHETRVGEPFGCFLCHPIRPTTFEKLNPLLPGMFKESWYGETTPKLLVVEPKVGGVDWMLPQRHRMRVKDVYAIVVSQ